jgi:hypothetical protein
MQGHEEFDDEEDETDVQNNYLTQAELFSSYTKQNNLFINVGSQAHWFENGGRRIANMNIDPINFERLRKKMAGQVVEYDEAEE